MRPGVLAILLWLTPPLLACSGGNEEQQAPFRLSPEPFLRIGSVDGDLPSQFNGICGALRTRDGRVVVGNAGSGELRIFDSVGHFVKAAGRRGAGPGEFGGGSCISPHLFRDSNLIASDATGVRVNVFDDSGNFVRTFSLESAAPSPWASVVGVAGGFLLVMSLRDNALRGPPGARIQTARHYALFDSLGKQHKTLFALEGRSRIVHKYGRSTRYPFLPFAPEALVAATASRIYLLQNTAPEVEVWSLAPERIATFTWPAERVRVRDVWDAYVSASLASMRREVDRDFYADFYRQNLPLPNEAPLASQLLVDLEGNLWIERYRLPGDSARKWDIVDSLGVFRGSTTTPASLEVYQVGTDFVLGRIRDSLDVEYVQLHRLRRK